MTTQKIVKRLRDEADKATLRVDDGLAKLLNEAADYLEWIAERRKALLDEVLKYRGIT